MAIFIRLFGIILLGLVGYHYINNSVGFSVAGSIATIIFGICLIEVYQGYQPDTGNWVGWGLIGFGCLLLALFKEFSWLLLLPSILIIIGYRLASLPFSLSEWGYGGTGGSDGGLGGSCGGDGCGGD